MLLPQQPSGNLPSQHKKEEMTTVSKGSGKKRQHENNEAFQST
jgi:hypothetical protein